MDHREGCRTEEIVEDPMTVPRRIMEGWTPQLVDELPEAFCGRITYFKFSHSIHISILSVLNKPTLLVCCSLMLHNLDSWSCGEVILKKGNMLCLIFSLCLCQSFGLALLIFFLYILLICTCTVLTWILCIVWYNYLSQNCHKFILVLLSNSVLGQWRSLKSLVGA